MGSFAAEGTIKKAKFLYSNSTHIQEGRDYRKMMSLEVILNVLATMLIFFITKSYSIFQNVLMDTSGIVIYYTSQSICTHTHPGEKMGF